MGEKTKAQRMASKKGMDEMSIEVQLRRRHKQNYPTVILNLTKRIQATNQTWARIAMQIMTIPSMAVNYECRDRSLVIEIAIGDETEEHVVTFEQLQEAHQYIEVFIMDKIDKSELIAKWYKENGQ